VGQDLLLRNEYLVTENRTLHSQIQGRVHLSDEERTALAEIGKKLGKQALAEVVTIVKPETILAWHHSYVTKRFDGSKQRRARGRPKIDQELEATETANIVQHFNGSLMRPGCSACPSRLDLPICMPMPSAGCVRSRKKRCRG
jgi:hypothetical protein